MSGHGFRERLAERAATLRIPLAEAEIEKLETYFDLLKRWNAKINLTALPLDGLPVEQSVERLFVEPLSAARFFPESALGWIDVGSGGGSPAIPLKVVRPAAKLTMVESRTRKAAFLREVVRTLNLADADVQSARFEDLESPDLADIVTVRAVRVDAPLLAACHRVLRCGGKLMLFQSAQIAAIEGFASVRREVLGDAGSSFLDIREAV